MVDPNVVIPAETAFFATLASGIAVTSTSTPTLNGNMALDATSAEALSKMLAAISIFNALPSGQSTFEYPVGSSKMWTQAQFVAMAKGAWQFAYACQQALVAAEQASAAFVAPSNAVSIP